MSVLIVHTGTNFGELRTQAAIYPPLMFLALDAQSAVDLFFVLSGFLITYLLLAEQERTQTISVSRFYVRRILRIWPLYYAIALIGFVVLPLLLGPTYEFYTWPARSIILVLLLLANLVGPLGVLGHLWSISLEEQFYLVWPWVSKNPQRLLKVAFGIIIIKLAIAPMIDAFHNDSISALFTSLRFECMAIGAIFAYVYFTKHAALRFLYSWVAQGITLLVILYLIAFDVPLTIVNTMIASVAFGILILNVATNPKLPIKLENRFTSTLGKISYGIYMFHFPMLYVVIYLLQKSAVAEGSETYKLVLYGATIFGTLILAALSYRYFETPILKLKARFESP